MRTVMNTLKTVLVASLLAFSGFATAQDDADANGAAATQPPAERFPCESNEKNRAFDFWIGDWNVEAQGQLAGTNTIEPILGDCVLFENWESTQGGTGKSFNYYDRAEGHWRQIWIDDRGGVIEFTGKVKDGVMYYTATTQNPANGGVTKHKLTFSQNDDGSVRQLWEQSQDDGENWQTVWDGKYVRQ